MFDIFDNIDQHLWHPYNTHDRFCAPSPSPFSPHLTSLLTSPPPTGLLLSIFICHNVWMIKTIDYEFMFIYDKHKKYDFK